VDLVDQTRGSGGLTSYRSDQLSADIVAALAKNGPQAKVALPTLIKAYDTYTEQRPRIEILMALGKIGSEAKTAARILNQALKGEDAALREAAAEAIEAIGGFGRPSEPATERNKKKH